MVPPVEGWIITVATLLWAFATMMLWQKTASSIVAKRVKETVVMSLHFLFKIISPSKIAMMLKSLSLTKKDYVAVMQQQQRANLLKMVRSTPA